MISDPHPSLQLPRYTLTGCWPVYTFLLVGNFVVKYAWQKIYHFKVRVQLHSFACEYPAFVEKAVPSLLNGFGTLVENQLIIYGRVYCQGLYSIPLVDMSTPAPASQCCNYCKFWTFLLIWEKERDQFVVARIHAFTGWLSCMPWPDTELATLERQDSAPTDWATWPGLSFEIRNYESSNFVLFFKVVLAIWSRLSFHMNLGWHFLKNFCKRCCDFYRDYIESINHFG